MKSKLKWAEVREKPHAELLEWYRQLIRLRKELPILTDGRRDRIQVDYNERMRWMVIRRNGNIASSVIIAFNLGAEASRHIAYKLGNQASVALTSEKHAKIDPKGFLLPPDSVIIVQAC